MNSEKNNMDKFLILLLSFLVGACAQQRILGGSKAPEGAFPYQISIRGSSGEHGCGGSIIDATTILTAAHCVNRTPVEKLTVVVGTNKAESGGTKHAVSRIIVHEEYNQILIKHDIALLKLATPIKFFTLASPVELETADVGAGVNAVLSGWGKTSYPGSMSNDLLYINLTTITVKDCRRRNLSIPFVREANVCTFTRAGEGACHGDSGGPLVVNGKQIGIDSWSLGCASGFPDVFTRVSSYVDWINKNK